MRLASHAILLASLLGACGVTGPTQEEKEAQRVRNELQVRLGEICDNTNRVVRMAADELLDRTEDPALKRLAIAWEMATFDATRSALAMPDRAVALLDLWTRLHQGRLYLEGDRAQEHLGDLVEIPRSANQTLLAYYLRAAGRVLGDEAAAKIEEVVVEFAREHPLENFIREWHVSLQSPQGRGVLASVSDLVPTLGIKDTAGSIAEVAESVDRVGDVVNDMPFVTRMNARLLLLDIQESDAIHDLRARTAEVARSVERLVEIAGRLPADVQSELSKTLDEIEGKQEELRRTLREVQTIATTARDTVERAGGILEDAKTTVETVDRTAANFAEAGKAWEPVMAHLLAITGPATEPDPDAPPGEDLKDLVELTANAREVAVELQATLREIREILDGEALPRQVEQADARVQGTLDRTASRLEGIVDLVFWRAVQLAVVIAALAVGARLLRRRSTAPDAPR